MNKLINKLSLSRSIKFLVKPALAATLALLVGYVVVEAPQLHHSYIRSKVGPSVVRITNLEQNSGGTGFAVEAPSGQTYILTNAHVCVGIEKPMVVDFKNNRQVPLRVIEVSRETDLCLVESVGNLKGLKMGSSLEIGDGVGIVGHPALMDLTLTKGDLIEFMEAIVPVPPEFCEQAPLNGGPFVETDNIFFPCVEVIKPAGQTTVQIIGGSSGSPVVNMFGNVVGVAFAGRNDTHWAVIVPLKEVEKFLKPY